MGTTVHSTIHVLGDFEIEYEAGDLPFHEQVSIVAHGDGDARVLLSLGFTDRLSVAAQLERVAAAIRMRPVDEVPDIEDMPVLKEVGT